MSIITLYHGTPNEFVTPQYGYGEDKHDYMELHDLELDLAVKKVGGAP